MSFDELTFMNANLYRQIAEKSGVELCPAGRNQLRQLIDLRVPEEVIRFYREAEPTRCAEIAKDPALADQEWFFGRETRT